MNLFFRIKPGTSFGEKGHYNENIKKNYFAICCTSDTIFIGLFVNNKQNILIFFKLNPLCDKDTCEKNHLIFFLCVFVVDSFLLWGCSTKGAALQNRRHNLSQKRRQKILNNDVKTWRQNYKTFYNNQIDPE